MRLLIVLLASLMGMSGLQADTIAPTDSISPSGIGVPLNTKILVRFVCCGSYGPNPVTVRTGAQDVAGTTEVINFHWILFTPAQRLRANTTYSVVVSLPYRSEFSGSFTTGSSLDTTPPTMVSSAPANLQDTATTKVPVQLRFSEPLNPKSLAAAPPRLVDLQSSSSPYGINPELAEPSTIQFSSYDGLIPGKVYRVFFPGSLPEDLSGNVMLPPAPDFLFTTYPAAPKDGARLDRSVPADSQTAVATNSAIVLHFDRPVIKPDAVALTLSADGDPNVGLKVEAIEARNTLILRPQTLLRGNRRYTLTVNRIYDQYGGQVAAGPLLTFTSGSVPEVRVFNVASMPAASLPNVRKVRWIFTRAVNPFLLPRLFSVSSGVYAPVRLLEDGATIEADVSGPGQYVLAGYVYDRVECKALTSSSLVTVSSVTDDQPPSAIAVFPPDQSTGVPPTVLPVIQFSEPIDALGADQVQLWQGADRVAATISTSGVIYTITPKFPLTAGLDYRAEFHAPLDLAGNTGADVVWSFHVDAPGNLQPFQVTQQEPALNSIGVAADAPIILTFSHPPNPTTLTRPGCGKVSTKSGTMPGQWRVDALSAIFQPDEPWPSSVQVNWEVCSLTDLRGQVLVFAGSRGSFWTAASDTPAPPLRIIGVTPAAGQSAIAGTNAVTLQFDHALMSSSLSNNSIWISTLAGQPADASISYDSSRRLVSISTASYAGGDFIVTASSEVRSLQGSRLEPFVALIRLTRPAQSYSYSMEPEPPSFLRSADIPVAMGVAIPDPPVVIHFRAPMDRALAEQGMRVVFGNAIVAGRIEWSPDSASLTFYPSTPLPPSGSGYVLLSHSPWSRSGVESQSISTPSAPSPDGSRLTWNQVSTLPSDAVIEVSFDRDMPAGYIQSAIARSVAPYGVIEDPEVLPLEISQRTTRVFRFVSKSPFSRKGYVVEFTTSDGGTEKAQFASAGYETPASRRMEVGPTDEMGALPVNGLIWLTAHTLLNPFTVHPSVTVGGESVRFVTQVSDGGMSFLLRPVGLLRGNSEYTVELKGVEDLAGRPLADRKWIFHTAAGADFVPAQLTSWSPKGSAVPTATISATFSKPVLFRRSVFYSETTLPYDFAEFPGGIRIEGSIFTSTDGRTLSYQPRRPWPAGREVGVTVDRFRYFDWTGLDLQEVRESSGNNLVTPRFTTSATAGAPPTVSARNPQPDAVDVPRNVRIQARFANGLLDSSLSRITLARDGEAVSARAVLDVDGRTVTILPEQVLDPNRLYTVSLAGVLSSDGTPRSEDEQWSFTTSGVAASLPGAPVVIPLWSEPFRFRVLFPRPVNPLSLDSAQVSLHLSQQTKAFEIALESGGNSISITPVGSSPVAGTWQVSVSGLTDWAGLSFSPAGLSASASEPASNEPPRVQSLIPTPGSTAASNTDAIVVFDRAVTFQPGSDGVRISLNGTPVDTRFRFLSPSALSITPLLGWRLGANYQIDVSGMIDQEGNQAAPVSWSFTIAADGLPEAATLRQLSVSPPMGSVGVAIDAPVVFEFSRPVYLYDNGYGTPVSIYRGQPPGLRVVADQNKLRVEPLPCWPPGADVSLNLSVRDAYGSPYSTSAGFSTAASQDKVPPRVESVSPTSGSRVPAGWNEFRLRFDEPVLAASGFAAFSCKGDNIWPDRIAMPAQGDGRTVVFSATLPASTVCTLNLSPALTDLSGNALSPVTFEYTTDESETETQLRIIGIQPASGSTGIPLDAAITLKFNLPLSASSLSNALQVSNDGYLVPVSLTPDATNQEWTIVSPTPWKPGTMVDLSIDTTVYSMSGLRMYDPFAATFRTVAQDAPSASGAALAALRAYPSFVDLRFASPLAAPPQEPFGLRLGQTRIPVVVDRMGPAWYRLTPGTRLDPEEHYTLMAGPGVEIPLRISLEETMDQTSAPVVTRGAGGRLLVQFERPIPAFSVDATTLVLLDRDGRQVPHTASLSPDGRTVIVEPLGIAPVQGLHWKDRRVAIQTQ
jgi:hypothetical protein